MLKIFSLNSAEFVTLNRIFSMFIGFLRAPPLDPTQGSDRVWTLLVTEGTPFVPSETNFWLRPYRPCQLVENFGPDLRGKCVKCGRLILRKIIETVATRGQDF